MQEANQIVAETLVLLQRAVSAGISTFELDQIAENHCRQRGATPAFKGYRGFPASICASINEEVVHGIPSRKRKVRKGDIISIDFGVKFKGFFGDSAVTVAVGKIDRERERLLAVTRQSLEAAIQEARPGNRVSDISKAVQEVVEQNGFAIVRQFVGHGIGSQLHEAPEVPNFYHGEQSARLLPGMVLAVEPMVNMGTHKVKSLKDGWTIVTADAKPSAHFEHSIAVTEDGPLVLSRPVSEAG
jgi:methionyl aminopeptidase